MSEMGKERTIDVPAEAAGQRLDQFVVQALAGQGETVSRSRLQMLVEQGDVRVNGEPVKASLKLRGGERIVVTGEPHPAPLKAMAEAIPLDVVYEDKDLAVVNKPAGMMVHRLDKDTSGLIVVAKNDRAHAALGEMFSERKMKKTYIALVQGAVERERGTINASLGRDPMRRTRMTTRTGEDGRTAVSHYQVLRRIATRFGKFTLVEVRIETGRTHQIRVHMASIGHPVVGDTVYGGSGQLTDQEAAQAATSKAARRNAAPERLRLGRNFLHAARLEFTHPITGKLLELEAPLPAELDEYLKRLEGEPATAEVRGQRTVGKMARS